METASKPRGKNVDNIEDIESQGLVCMKKSTGLDRVSFFQNTLQPVAAALKNPNKWGGGGF